MNPCLTRISLAIWACLSCTLTLQAELSNWWPLYTARPHLSGDASDWTAFGPFLESRHTSTQQILSFRPLWTQFESTEREATSRHLLYPLFSHYDYTHHSHWHVLNLIRRASHEDSDYRSTQIFPFYFSRQTGDPETSYRALWPIGGTLRNFLWRDRMDFIAWPLFLRTEKGTEIRYSTPWPFIQYRTGEDARGFGLWPIYGRFQREADYDRTWALWPLIYHYRDNLDQEVPYERFGILPLYASERADGMRSQTFLWPFFGYTRENEPRPLYRENRYLWPFFVQGRGEEKHVNRWMPFYTHESRGDQSKHWYLWPVLKREHTQLPALERQRTQVLFFIYRDEHLFNSDRGFSARRSYLWPLYGYNHNGAGHRQFQTLDPLGVFFPRNEKIRENWSPLFALYRYDRQPERTRHSLLWNLFVLERGSDQTGAIYLGPLFERVNDGSSGHWSVLKGLVGRSRQMDETQWTFFWNSF